MLAYPTEDNKGKFIAIFWSIFNMGGVVGATVSLGQNYGSSVSAASLRSFGVWVYSTLSIMLLFFCLGKLGYVSWSPRRG